MRLRSCHSHYLSSFGSTMWIEKKALGGASEVTIEQMFLKVKVKGRLLPSLTRIMQLVSTLNSSQYFAVVLRFQQRIV
jgi:hypothetical protein